MQECIDFIWVAGLAGPLLEPLFERSAASASAAPQDLADADAIELPLPLTMPLSCVATWELPTQAVIGAGALPSVDYPSDHLALGAEFSWAGQ